MLYAEAAYFDGAHVQHIADYYEKQRIDRLRQQGRRLAMENHPRAAALRMFPDLRDGERS